MKNTQKLGLPLYEANDPADLIAGYNTAMDILDGRKLVVFGDSWTHLFNEYIPTTVASLIGGTLVKNYGVPGAFVGNVAGAINTSTQISAAAADTSVDKDTVTDVLVMGSVNNIGGTVRTINDIRDDFAAFRIYPHARYWFVQNAKQALNADSDALRSWYFPMQRGASLAGFAVAHHSPLWLLDENWASYWDGTDWTQRHPNQTGVTAWTRRLAGFLTGQDYVPSCDIPITLNTTLSAKLVASNGLSINAHALRLEGYSIVFNIQLIGREPDTSKFADIGLISVFSIPQCFAPSQSPYMPVSMAAQHQAWGDWELKPAGVLHMYGTGAASMDAEGFRENQGFLASSGEFDLS